MDGGGGSNGGSLSYYAILGIRKDASFSDIRSAYHKLAMVTILTSFHKSTTFFFSRQKFSDRLKLFFFLVVIMKKWHPDRSAKNPGVAGEAKRRFQQIQEAYSGKVIETCILTPLNSSFICYFFKAFTVFRLTALKLPFDFVSPLG